MLNFKGIFTAIVTPFTHEGVFDRDSFRRMISLQVKAGVHGIVVSGTTGESPNLSQDEFVSAIKIAKELVVQTDTILVVGTGTNSTSESIKKSKLAAELGADALLVVTPYYNKPSQEGLFRHFQTISNELAPLPIILYDVPGRTGIKMDVDTVLRLAEISNVVGIKDATGDLNRIVEFKEVIGKDFVVFSGDDPLFVPSLKSGADGIISVASNLIPEKMVEMFERATDDFAMLEHQKLLPFFNGIFMESNPVPIKWALYKRGYIISSKVRLPLWEPSKITQDKLEDIMREVGV